MIRIYMPNERSGKYIYGHKRSEVKDRKTLIDFIIIASSDKVLDDTKLELLGTISQSRILINDGINLLTNDQHKIMKVMLNGQDLTDDHRILLLHYEKERFLQSFEELCHPCSIDDDFALLIAKSLQEEHEKEHKEAFFNQLSIKSHNFLIGFSTAASEILQFLSPVFRNTVIFRHCSNWRKCLNDEHSRNGFVVLDVLLGIIFFTIMNLVPHSGQYFMGLTETIVNKLRNLLEMLDGAPAGLKLNVQLNNFLLSCFMYHVDLWWNFIVIVEPAIHYLFFPITMFGLMGFSFQCAMLCDLITLITLHAHCFYIYAAMLYKLELTSIRSLLRIVLGRRLNVLKSEFKTQLNVRFHSFVILQTVSSHRITQTASFFSRRCFSRLFCSYCQLSSFITSFLHR